MITSTFNNELQILETEFNGDITAKAILDYLIAFKENNTYPRKLKSIIDTTRASIKFSYKDLKSFNEEKNKSLENYNIVFSAIIINSPSKAALGTLYGAMANNKKYTYKLFSTHEAALFWINSFHFKPKDISA